MQRTRSESEDVVRRELEPNLQNGYDVKFQNKVHAIQDECQDHVSGEELKSIETRCTQSFIKPCNMNPLFADRKPTGG